MLIGVLGNAFEEVEQMNTTKWNRMITRNMIKTLKKRGVKNSDKIFVDGKDGNRELINFYECNPYFILSEFEFEIDLFDDENLTKYSGQVKQNLRN